MRANGREKVGSRRGKREVELDAAVGTRGEELVEEAMFGTMISQPAVLAAAASQ